MRPLRRAWHRRALTKHWLAAQAFTRKAAVEVFVSILLAQGTPTADTAWILAVCNASLILGLVVPRHCVAAHPPFRYLQVLSEDGPSEIQAQLRQQRVVKLAITSLNVRFVAGQVCHTLEAWDVMRSETCIRRNIQRL